jgi:osmotically-inducible protein OsmY
MTLSKKTPTSDRRYLSLVASVSLGTLIGGALMFLLDPKSGRRRRAVSRDKVNKAGRQALHKTRQLARHVQNQIAGTIATASLSLSDEGVVSDKKLERRLRSVLGRSVSHPTAIDIAVHKGAVQLRGYLAPHEIAKVLNTVRATPGVRSVDNQIIDRAETRQLQEH